MKDNVIQVMLIEPMKRPTMIEISNDLESMQNLVKGLIQEYMPFDDDVAIICNEEGKINGMLPNRGIFNQSGELQDIIFGSFFLCNAPAESEKFLGLTEAQQEKYKEYFRSPERFFVTTQGIKVQKIAPAKTEMER